MGVSVISRGGNPVALARQLLALVTLSFLVSDMAAFQPVALPPNRDGAPHQQNCHYVSSRSLTLPKQGAIIAAIRNEQQPEPEGSIEKKSSRFQRFKTSVKKAIGRNAAIAVFVGAATGGFWQVFTPPRADASAPVMAIPKAEARDPATEAMMNHERKMVKKAQDDLAEMNRMAREIEANEGEAAREKFEQDYKQQQQEAARQKTEGLENLKRELLDQGIDPFVDFEGKRQVTFYEKGVDVGAIPGTQLHLEKELERTNYKKSMAYKTEPNRRVIKCMVQDMKNRGMDPLEYFAEHQTKTEQILQMPLLQAAQLAQKYEANLQQYGQITVPKEGEMSTLEKMQKGGGKKASAADVAAQKKAKEEAKRVKAEASAKAAAEKKAAKENAKKEKEAAKEAAKKEKEASKAAAAAAAAAATASAAAATAASSHLAEAGAEAVASSLPSPAAVIEQSVNGEADDFMDSDQDDDDLARDRNELAPTKATKQARVGDKKIPIIPLAGTVVAVGGGGYVFKIIQERNAANEEERQRQFRLLMGIDKDKGENDNDEDPSFADEATKVEKEKPKKVKKVEDKPKKAEDTTESATPTKKRKVGGFFAKKGKNDRETDLNNLISGDARAPEFATLLAKILTYGAPGRFPDVEALPGAMPFPKTFDLEEANNMLVDARTEAGISMEESAEVFANVVNAMLIDIVDLASSALKEKDDKILVDAINVVVDYMNHAASLYDSVAGGITINPVTYGGSLGAKSLEQMYSSYAVSGMMSMGGNIESDFDSRVGLLKDVFQISDKKAEGLMMKAMQKNMMKMMKSGEGLEGMEDMLKNMGGLGGMGLPGMPGEDLNPEQLKEMLVALKQMKEDGGIEAEEFDAVKKQFKEAFGASIDDIIKNGKEAGEEMTAADEELLDLMKSILDE